VTLVVVGAGGWLGSAICARLPEALQVTDRSRLCAVLDAAGPNPLIINAAGAKTGNRDELREGNEILTRTLLEAVGHGWLIQFGSAAEFGLNSPFVTAATPLRPSSDYGRSKRCASKMAIDSGRATVLRPFNIADSPPQRGSPLADIAYRIQAGVAARRSIEVLSAQTRRDYVTRGFVVDSVLAAMDIRAVGAFSVCSGIPVAVADIARAGADRLGSAVGIRDLQQHPPSTIYGDPKPWETLCGLRQALTAEDIAALLFRAEASASNGCHRNDHGTSKRGGL
jgi:nucleoside-diphosphate-sugar epimerase